MSILVYYPKHIHFFSQLIGRRSINDYSVVDRIINLLKLAFAAERPPPPRVVQQELLMAAEERGEYF
jgi:hypothetical protein